MNCGEWAVSNEFGDYIVVYNIELERQLQGNPDVCLTKLDSRFGIVHYRRSLYEQTIEETGYNAIPKLYAPMDLTAPEAVGAVWNFSQPNLDLRGRNVLIGVIDTGIDLAHPAFLDEAGQSRIVALWDQTDETGTAPEGLGYGSAYDQAQIEVLLAERRADPGRVLPGRDETGHGTFLAGVAAGRQDRAADFVGAAPEAKLAVIKLKQAKPYLRDFFFVREGAEAYQESDIMAALSYLASVQFQNYRPMVICIGLGSNMGGHTGSTALSQMLERFSANWGMAAVVPTGNEANASHHYQGAIGQTGGTERVEIRVPENSRGFSVELWGGISEQYQVSVRAPGGQTIPAAQVGPTNSDVYEFFLEGTRVYVDYVLIGSRAEGQLVLMRFDRPSPGIWEILVEARTIIRGVYHLWLPVSGLVQEGTVFLRPNPDVTLTDPANAEGPISAAGYNHRNQGIFLDSGRGFTRFEAIKPDVAAPAVQVYGPLPGGRYGNRSGTSAAAALTAGICADLLEWGIVRGNDPYMNQVRLKDYLIRGATRGQGRTYPNREWGYGTVSLEGVFRALQG